MSWLLWLAIATISGAFLALALFRWILGCFSNFNKQTVGLY
jgi:hypothetical protein